jgi:hypothetical protein
MASQSSSSRATIAQIWEESIEEYEKATGKSLRLGKFKSMDEIMAGTEDLSSKFKDFRSDESKVTKVRTALKNNMWLIQRVVNTVQSVGNAASVSSGNEPLGELTKETYILSCTGLPTSYARQFDLYGLRTGHAVIR